MSMGMNRRQFIKGSALAVAVAGTGCAMTKEDSSAPSIAPQALIASAPVLQNAAETSIGVSFAVSADASGWVEYSTSPDLKDATKVFSGEHGLMTVDDKVALIRVTGLKPATKYYYRIGADRIEFKGGYAMKNLGPEVDPKIHSFTTLGAAATGAFCVINDTHNQKEAIRLALGKLAAVKPSVVIWNGDASNTSEKIEQAMDIFIHTHTDFPEYAADMPYMFLNGNHDFRGSWISKKEEVMQPRHPAERSGAEWDLKWNFAVRMGDVALIGMDTGEDKPDGHPKWFGLANFEPYRKAQAAWLEKALSRPDIASAKYKVVFCHIPLYAAPDHPDYPHDGVKIDPHDYAYWSRECHDLWSPILVKNGVQLVICAHKHKYRFDPATAERPWAQIVGGGCELPKDVPERFPTVIEGMVEDGKLKITIHNLKTGVVQAVHEIAATRL